MKSRHEAGRDALIQILEDLVMAEFFPEQQMLEQERQFDEGQVQIVGAGVTAVDVIASSNDDLNRDAPCR